MDSPPFSSVASKPSTERPPKGGTGKMSPKARAAFEASFRKHRKVFEKLAKL